MEVDLRATIQEPTDADLAAELGPENAPPAWVAVSRGVTFFLGFFALLCLLAELRQPADHADLWWLDLRCRTPVARAGLSLAAVLLLALAVRPALPEALRLAAVTLTVALLGVTVWRTLGFYSTLRGGELRSEVALPFSLHLAACLTVALAGLRARVTANRLEPGGAWLFATGFLICAVTFPLAQIYCLGRTDYRRPAEAVLVRAEGLRGSQYESPELAECIRTARALLREGLADRLILADGQGNTERAEAIRRQALAEGIPAEQIRVLSPEALAEKNVDGERSRPILAVGPFYQLPRLRLMWSRSGREVCTVPAPESDSGSERVWRIAREVGALWSCYLRPFAG